MGEFFIITGGLGNGNGIADVSNYSRTGWVADLPRLNTARRGHACSKYRDVGGQDVLLVTGGYGNGVFLSSTEIIEDQGVVWTFLQSASLPSARYFLRAATFNNRLLLFGIRYRQ